MNPREIDLWTRRSESLKEATEYARKFFVRTRLLNDGLAVEAEQDLRQLSANFEQLATALEAYVSYVFDGYFLAGFSNSELTENKAYPKAYVLERILSQASTDLASAIQLWAQTVASLYMPLANLDRESPQWDLGTAHHFAERAIGPARDKELVRCDTTVLPYFRKAPNIRTIPYAPVAFMGVPYSSLRACEDLLAIPHETGHHVYWLGRAGENAYPIWFCLNQVLNQGRNGSSQMESLIYELREEIFADVYACLIAGPVAALSAQQMQLAAPDDQFTSLCGAHPPPIIRPRIYTKVLAQTGQCHWANALEDRWRGEVENHMTAARERESDRLADSDGQSVLRLSNGEIVELDRVIDPGLGVDSGMPIDRIIAECLAILEPFEIEPVVPVQGDDIDVDRLYDGFEAWLAAARAEQDGGSNWPKIDRIPERKSEEGIRAQVAEWEELALADGSVPGWRYVFENGWADKGSHGRQ